jgi:hypothetical protein
VLAVPSNVFEQGYFGVSAYVPDPHRLAAPTALSSSVRQMGSMTWASMYSLYRFFSPSGLTGFAHQVATTPPAGTDVPAAAPPASHPSAPAYPPLPQSPLDQPERIHSILGIVDIGSQLNLPGLIVLLALLNVFLGLFNLLPLLPFDGGHIAVATYERIREGLSRLGLVKARLQEGRYLADFSKLLPLTYAVVALIVLIGMGALWLDAINPPVVR